MSLFTFLLRSDLALSDLTSLQYSGYSVIRSAHVGNLFPRDLVIAKAGVTMCLYDRMVTGQDQNYHPHVVLCDGKITKQIAGKGLLVGTQSGLVKTHLHALRDSIPSSSILTQSDLERSWSNDLVLSIFSCLSKLVSVSYWNRRVQPDGSVVKDQPWSWGAIMSDGVYGLTSYSGWVLPLQILSVLELVCESIRTERCHVYHLGGYDMTSYFPIKILPFLEGVMPGIIEELNLPPLYYHLVPTGDFRFAVPVEEGPALSEVFRVLTEKDELDQLRSLRFQKVTNEERSALVEWSNTARDDLSSRLDRVIGSCPSLFYETREANFFSQHDLVAGRELYIQPDTFTMSAAEASSIMKQLRVSAKRVGIL